MFLPAFFMGVLISRVSKKYLTLEPLFASPWVSIFSGLAFGSVVHYLVKINI
jgi:hypothetical protein